MKLHESSNPSDGKKLFGSTQYLSKCYRYLLAASHDVYVTLSVRMYCLRLKYIPAIVSTNCEQ